MTQAVDSTITQSVTVDAPRERACEVFTECLGDWFPREYNLLEVDIEERTFETREGGRIYDRGTDGSECSWGKVRAARGRGAAGRTPSSSTRRGFLANDIDPRNISVRQDSAVDSSYRIRAATVADQQAVNDALVASGVDAWAGFLGEELIVRANAERDHPADLVAEDERGVFGFVAWDSVTGEITRLYVHPRAQRCGAGRALLDRALVELRAAGRRTAWLNTEERNRGALKFYERLGWAEEGSPRVRMWHGARLVEPLFVKRL